MVVLCVGALGWVMVTAKFVDVISNANPDVTAFRYHERPCYTTLHYNTHA